MIRPCLLVLAVAACSESSSSPDAALLPVDAAPIDSEGPCPIAVNEVAPAGQPADWFEVINRSINPVDLSQFAFIDEADDPAAAVPLPATILAPGARHVQEVSDADNGFGLGAGDALWLYVRASGVRCDGADWDSGDAPSGSSWARIPDGVGPFMTTTPDTRGVANR